MIRFALIAASTLGFFLTAALGNLMVPLLRAFQGRWDEPKARQAPSPKQEAPDAEPERPPRAPTMGGLCLMVGCWLLWAWAGLPPVWLSLSCWGPRACSRSGCSQRCWELCSLAVWACWRIWPASAAVRCWACGGTPALGWKPLPVPWCWCCWGPEAALQPGSPCRVWAMSIWALPPRCCGKGC